MSISSSSIYSLTPFQLSYDEGLFIDYRYMDQQNITPQFEFGYGLSYTTFDYSALSISASGTSQEVTFTVTNTGAFDGTEIPQLYLGFPEGAGEPKMILRGFDEVILAKGASTTVSMTIKERDMRYVVET